jgi:hypothetical protein
VRIFAILKFPFCFGFPKGGAAEMTEQIPAGQISTANLGRLLMLSAERVRQLANSGKIPKAGRDRFVIVEACQAYFELLRAEPKGETASANRVQTARAIEIENRVRRESDKLAEVKGVIEFVAEMNDTLRKSFDGFAERLTTDPATRRKIQTEVDDIFRRSVDRAAVSAAKLRGARA